MWLQKKIKAGALQYILVISVIIALLIFAFISLLYLQKKVQIKNSFFKETVLNVQSGFDYFVFNSGEYNTPKQIQLSNNPLEKTTLVQKPWGIFDIGIVTSIVKNETFQQIALLGNHDKKREALYLQDNNNSLVLVGKTKITGNVSLPKQGAKAGNIAGTSYYGRQLIYGTSKTSSKELPEVKNSTTIKNLLNQSFLNEETLFFNLEERVKTHSFNEKTLVHSSFNPILLSDVQLQGNLIIHSKTKITIDNTAQLNDIILIAPTIDIKRGVKGNFQAIASKNITVAENATLQYPSALILYNKNKQQQSESTNSTTVENAIKIAKNATVKGVLLYQSENEKTDYNPHLIISENATITGEVYCSKNLELLGSVYGSVYTQNFITKQFGSVYVNHIYNGIINAKKLPEQFCGLSFKNPKLKVAKWLY